jgi:hypothetical protein
MIPRVEKQVVSRKVVVASKGGDISAMAFCLGSIPIAPKHIPNYSSPECDWSDDANLFDSKAIAARGERYLLFIYERAKDGVVVRTEVCHPWRKGLRCVGTTAL